MESLPFQPSAQQFPEEVAGIVLIDFSHENQRFRFPQDSLENSAHNQMPMILRLCQLFAQYGFAYLVVSEMMSDQIGYPKHHSQILWSLPADPSAAG